LNLRRLLQVKLKYRKGSEPWIAALIGIFITQAFGLSAASLIEGSRESARAIVLEGRIDQVSNLNIPQILLSFIPSNPFADLTGSRSTSMIAVVIFSSLLGLAAHKVSQENEKLSLAIHSFVDATQAIVMRLVKMIMALTPYGLICVSIFSGIVAAELRELNAKVNTGNIFLK
jgi:L-cystine uptake protein TcyP (sodium:dicarboxylate symporter family)